MSRLFVFAIGGSGARVLKSLTMLLASGVRPETETEWEIVPIIVDPHEENKDVARTIDLMKRYRAISEKAKTLRFDGFFSTEIGSLPEIMKDRGRNDFLSLEDVGENTFGQYIDFDHLVGANKALAQILFSGRSGRRSGNENENENENDKPIPLLNLKMNIGFVGNPNIGTVVLNQLNESPELKAIAKNFTDGDRFFIISSIFGGTGAAGFPILLKNLRNPPEDLDKRAALMQSKIGALTLGPYFSIEVGKANVINAAHFVQKTKSALQYYADNVSPDLDRTYYLADTRPGDPIPNDPGEDGQKNPAYFIELAGALSIIDFLATSDGDLDKKDSKKFRAFAIENSEPQKLFFEHLGDVTRNQIKRGLTQMYLFWMVAGNAETRRKLLRNPWAYHLPKINDHFFAEEDFFTTLILKFLGDYKSWLVEMSESERGFMPFDFDGGVDKLFNRDETKADDSTGRGRAGSKQDALLTALNAAAKNRSGDWGTAAEKLVKSMAIGTRSFLDESFSLK